MKPAPAQLSPRAVTDDGLIALLGLNDGRGRKAALAAACKFRQTYHITTLPGGVYALAQIDRAMERLAR